MTSSAPLTSGLRSSTGRRRLSRRRLALGLKSVFRRRISFGCRYASFARHGGTWILIFRHSQLATAVRETEEADAIVVYEQVSHLLSNGRLSILMYGQVGPVGAADWESLLSNGETGQRGVAAPLSVESRRTIVARRNKYANIASALVQSLRGPSRAPRPSLPPKPPTLPNLPPSPLPPPPPPLPPPLLRTRLRAR